MNETTGPTRRLAGNAMLFSFPILMLCVPRGASMVLVAILLAWLLTARGAPRLVGRQRQMLYLLGAVILAVAAVCFGSKLHYDLDWGALDNPSRLLLIPLGFLAVLHCRPQRQWLWRGIPVAIGLALAVMLVQKIGMAQARPSAFLQPIAFGNMVAALGLIGFARPGRRRRDHLLAWGTLVGALLVLGINGSRGAWVATLMVFPLLLPVRHQGMRVRGFVLSVGAMLLLLVAAYLVPGSPVASRVDRIGTDLQMYRAGDPNSSIGARLLVWRLAARAAIERPLMGVGLGRFGTVTGNLDGCAERERKRYEFCLAHAHNDAMEALATTGVPGLLAMLSIFAVPGWLFAGALRRRRQEGVDWTVPAAGLAFTAASVISGLTQVTMAHQANIVFYAGATGLLLGLTALGETTCKATESNNSDRSSENPAV
ncbi:O-antigen ligase [Cupriavidus sp. AU9028]|uniref:O-antigen ligase family protein n=1 Tax=Cupriavidus sp. AU9028 TaxID=2871157 RepID=UPI0021071478|nr:O-antigen ligase family protein [Cupriavidus sp. AU9028]